MDTDKLKMAIINVVLGFIAAFGLAFCLVGSWNDSAWRAKAVKAGHAEWIANPEGKASFQWRTNCTNP